MCIRYAYEEALKEWKKIEIFLQESGYEYSITGSMRRKKSTIGDIDVIIKAKESEFERIISNCCEITDILDKDKFIVNMKSGIPLQLIFADENYILNLWSSTGSKKHVKNIKEIYKEKRIELMCEIFDEQEIYEKIGLDYISPEKREE